MFMSNHSGIIDRPSIRPTIFASDHVEERSQETSPTEPPSNLRQCIVSYFSMLPGKRDLHSLKRKSILGTLCWPRGPAQVGRLIG